MTFVYICIPAHDEEQTIGPLLWKIRRVMAEYERDYHIVVADDASTDATPEILASYERVLPLTVIRCAQRRGYAQTLERALRKAARLSRYPKRDTIVTLQADFTDDPSLIPELVRHIEGGADIVGNDAPRDMSGAGWAQRAARRAFDGLCGRSGVPKGVGSPAARFRGYRAAILRKAFEDAGDAPLLRSDGWCADLELLRAVVPHARKLAAGTAPEIHGRRQRPTRFQAREGLRQIRGAFSGGTVPGSWELASPEEDLGRQPLRQRGPRRRRPAAESPGEGSGRRHRTGGRNGPRPEPAGEKAGTSRRRRKRRRRGGSRQRSPGADSS